MEGVAIDRRGRRGLHASEPDAHRDGRLEGGRGLEAIDPDRLRGQQALVGGVSPPEFGPLALGQAHVGVGQDRDEVFQGRGLNARQRGDDPVARAEEVVAGVEGRGDPPLPMERGPAIPHRVVILDVVVDKRRLVEDLDGDRGSAGRVSRRLAGGGQRGPLLAEVGDDGVKGCERDKRPQELATPGEEVGRHFSRGRE